MTCGRSGVALPQTSAQNKNHNKQLKKKYDKDPLSFWSSTNATSDIPSFLVEFSLCSFYKISFGKLRAPVQSNELDDIATSTDHTLACRYAIDSCKSATTEAKASRLVRKAQGQTGKALREPFWAEMIWIDYFKLIELDFQAKCMIDFPKPNFSKKRYFYYFGKNSKIWSICSISNSYQRWNFLKLDWFHKFKKCSEFLKVVIRSAVNRIPHPASASIPASASRIPHPHRFPHPPKLLFVVRALKKLRLK